MKQDQKKNRLEPSSPQKYPQQEAEVGQHPHRIYREDELVFDEPSLLQADDEMLGQTVQQSFVKPHVDEPVHFGATTIQPTSSMGGTLLDASLSVVSQVTTRSDVPKQHTSKTSQSVQAKQSITHEEAGYTVGLKTVLNQPSASSVAQTEQVDLLVESKQTNQKHSTFASHLLQGSNAAVGPSDSFARSTQQTGALRRYTDGSLVALSGSSVEERLESHAADISIFKLPYESKDVLRRLGQYDLLSELGKGAMGTVYKAFSLHLCRFCAIKVMIVTPQITEASILRFQNEAMIAARLKHPNIVPIFDSGEDDGIYYFVMEFVDGGCLTDWVKAGTDEALEKGLVALEKVARALHYAHEHGVIHRDIKPDNILLDREGEPYITDFGIAKETQQNLQLTAEDTALGTAYYMSPEQANGEHSRIGPWSDVYALGSTMFHLITGRVPFVGNHFFQLLVQVISKEPESPIKVAQRVLGRTLPQELEVICLKSMEKVAAQRYTSADAFADDLQAFRESRDIDAKPLSSKEKMQKFLRQNRAAFVGSMAVLGILLVMTVSFGTILLFNIQKTSQTLRALDRKAAIENAATLERAIRSNMLEGRADIVRNLVAKLRKDPKLRNIEVVRQDQTLAYTDLRTRKFVAKRLANEDIIQWIRQNYSEVIPKIKDLKQRAFKNIDNSKLEKPRTFPFPFKRWEKLLKEQKMMTQIEKYKGEDVLTVLWPIKNSGACQSCHGTANKKGFYGAQRNQVRAILVVRRSQKELNERIRSNRMATASIGGVTTFIFLALILLFARLFNVGLKPNSFGRDPSETTSS